LRGAGDSKRDDISSDILSYFLRNPDARDSFEGIARWRLLEELVRRSVPATEEALHWLIANGFLTEEQVPGGKPIYRLNPSRKAEAERLIAAAKESKAKSSEAEDS
jgi:hypothetical protein